MSFASLVLKLDISDRKGFKKMHNLLIIETSQDETHSSDLINIIKFVIIIICL